MQHGNPAENTLGDHGGERGPSQLAHPGTAVHLRGPDGQHDGQQSDELRDDAMPVFPADSADQRHGEVAVGHRPMIERGRPIGNGEPGVIAGDQGAGDDEQKSAEGDHGRKAMVGLIERCG